jgi:hypothetical protein
MEPITTMLAGFLATKGFSLLQSLLSKATDKGIEKAAEFIETKVGIPLVNHDGKFPELSDTDVKRIAEVITENRLELERILNEKEKMYLDDKKDARYAQKTHVQTYAEVVKECGEDAASGLWLSVNFIYIFAILLTVCIFTFIFLAVFTTGVPTEKLRFIDIAIGNLFGILNIIIGFFFGSAIEKNRKESELVLQTAADKKK